MTVHNEEYKGHEIEIDYDIDPMNPRTECDNLGTMVCFHGRYDLGDKDHGFSLEEAREIETDINYISLPLYLYDHSGITMNTTGFSCPWDSGQVGVIFVSKETVRKEYGVKRISKKLRENVLRYLRCEVEEYDQYLRGEIYCFSIEDENGDVVDSCCGLHDLDYCIEYAKNSVNFIVDGHSV